MPPIRTSALLFAALMLAATPALAQPKEEPSLPEQIIEGVRGFFRQLFGGDSEKSPPTLGGEDRTPQKSEPPAAAKGEAAPKPEAKAEAVKPTPVAQTAPASLHAIVAKGDVENSAKLITEGADIEARDPNTGASVLHYAVMRGNPEILDLLLARGADVNSRTKNGTTPLHTAVLYNRYEVAEKLIAKGADVNAQSASGATPLALASAAKNRTIAELLREKGAK